MLFGKMDYRTIAPQTIETFSFLPKTDFNPQELASILKLSELGNTDWKAIFDNFSEIGTNFSKENLKEDIDNLYAMGVSLASAGANNLVNSIIGNSSFNGTIMDKANSVIDIADNIYDLYNILSPSASITIGACVRRNCEINAIAVVSLVPNPGPTPIAS